MTTLCDPFTATLRNFTPLIEFSKSPVIRQRIVDAGFVQSFSFPGTLPSAEEQRPVG
jgi:hypothetical protein